MSTSEEYVRRAEECERLAAACRAPSNREILQRAATQWRRMADEAAVGKLRPIPDKEVAKDERPHLSDQSLFVRGKPASGRESWS
jgi:hypothetical protein